MADKNEAGIMNRVKRAVSTAPDIKQKNYPKWPSDHPYAYTIGDVEYREVEDHKTGKKVQLLFGLNEWPKPSLKLPEIKLAGGPTDDKKEEKKPKDHNDYHDDEEYIKKNTFHPKIYYTYRNSTLL
eukprot:88375_1